MKPVDVKLNVYINSREEILMILQARKLLEFFTIKNSKKKSKKSCRYLKLCFKS